MKPLRIKWESNGHYRFGHDEDEIVFLSVLPLSKYTSWNVKFAERPRRGITNLGGRACNITDAKRQAIAALRLLGCDAVVVASNCFSR